MRRFDLAEAAIFPVVLALFIVAVLTVWHFTGEPMMANYHQCGTIFLCQKK